MNAMLERRAFAVAVLAAALSLGGAWATAATIKLIPGTAMASDEIAVSPDLIAQGQEFYGMSCSHCHADDATGDEGPSLHNLTISNARIAATIRKGVKGQMPAFGKKYDDKQIAALVSYLRSLK
jgi:mono/diheme cytochrome c family protein